MASHVREILQTPENEWITFPGGELAGKRPARLCAACRARLQQAARSGRAATTRDPICFRCYREQFDRDKALKAAGELETASEQRFQTTLPFAPLDDARLAALKAARASARVAARGTPIGRLVDRRRHAQIAARHALQAIAAGLRDYHAPSARQRFDAAVHAAELQLPESWLPFVSAASTAARKA